jgi:hypothetical protein
LQGQAFAAIAARIATWLKAAGAMTLSRRRLLVGAALGGGLVVAWGLA